MLIPKPITTGVRTYGEGDTLTLWWLYPRLDDDQVGRLLDLPDFQGHYSGPGMPFVDRASIRHSCGHSLVTQRQGWDV